MSRNEADKESLDTIKRLTEALAARRTLIERYDSYYRGKQGRRFIRTRYRDLFAALFENYAENFCGVVVDAVAERLNVEGFRFPREGTPEGEADSDAWRIWQDNRLDAESQIAHTESLVKGIVYVLVSPFPSEFVGQGGRSPRITVEDPLQTIVELGHDRSRLVGMKRWWDGQAKRMFVTLYWPDRIEKFQSDGRYTETSIAVRYATELGVSWQRRAVPGEPWPLENPLGVVPIVPLVNRPRLDGSGESEIEKIIPIQDAINTLAMNELIASDFASFKQKWATGVEIPKGPDGKPLPEWQPDLDQLLHTPAADAKFGTFEASELEQYGKAIDRRVQRIASISATPFHYFTQHGGQPPSAESIKSAEAPLVRKSRRKHRDLGEGWEEVERLAFRVLEDDRAEIMDSETVWASPETLTEAEHVDALTKLLSLHVPIEQLWADAGYTPTQRASFLQMLARQRDLLADVAPPPTVNPPPDGPGTPTPVDTAGGSQLP